MVLLASGYLSPEDQAHVSVVVKAHFDKELVSLGELGLALYSGGSKVPAVARLAVIVPFSWISKSIIPPQSGL